MTLTFNSCRYDHTALIILHSPSLPLSLLLSLPPLLSPSFLFSLAYSPFLFISLYLCLSLSPLSRSFPLSLALSRSLLLSISRSPGNRRFATARSCHLILSSKERKRAIETDREATQCTMGKEFRGEGERQWVSLNCALIISLGAVEPIIYYMLYHMFNCTLIYIF